MTDSDIPVALICLNPLIHTYLNLPLFISVIQQATFSLSWNFFSLQPKESVKKSLKEMKNLTDKGNLWQPKQEYII